LRHRLRLFFLSETYDSCEGLFVGHSEY
jgi:hypothetical protein